MHVLAVFCHPKRESFSGAVLDRFAEGVSSAGHTIEIADLHREGFDPVMTARDLEQFDGVAMPDDVLAEQARVERCDALAFVFPIWWYGMPALFKGWLDRVWSNGWAYAWEHDPEGSLLRPRPCVMLVPTGASRAQPGFLNLSTLCVAMWRVRCGRKPRKAYDDIRLSGFRPQMAARSRPFGPGERADRVRRPAWPMPRIAPRRSPTLSAR